MPAVIKYKCRAIYKKRNTFLNNKNKQYLPIIWKIYSSNEYNIFANNFIREPTLSFLIKV